MYCVSWKHLLDLLYKLSTVITMHCRRVWRGFQHENFAINNGIHLKQNGASNHMLFFS